MTAYTLKDIPDSGFWKQVKILAATKGTTIKQMIIDLLKKEIDKNAKK